MRGLAVIFLVLTTVATAEPWTTSDKARLEILKTTGGFQVRLTNLQSRPLAVVPPRGTWTHMWNVTVVDKAGREYGLLVPPGPAFLAEPDRFTLLDPNKSLSARFKFADFIRVDRATDTTEKLKSPAQVRVAYTFEPATELGHSMRMLEGPTSVQDPKPNPELQKLKKAWKRLFTQADFLKPMSAGKKL